jgi:fused signal recognition particle receptor
MFNFIKNSLKKIYAGITSRLGGLFGKAAIDEQALNELSTILLSADTGVKTTNAIIKALRTQHQNGALEQGTQLKQALRNQLISILNKPSTPDYEGNVFILVGVNGSGKTTFAGKLAYKYAQEGKKVLLVAADTFRAAASEQLEQWSLKIGVDIVRGSQDQDPASVVFQGCDRFKKENYDILIIDTAGRLHTKVNLMNELSKVKRVITKQLPDEKVNTLLIIDSMLGQNSFEQAKLFHESTDLSGIVLTKMDGTGKGGIVFAITDELAIPIWYITFGEQLDQLKLFDKNEYVDNLLNT